MLKKKIEWLCVGLDLIVSQFHGIDLISISSRVWSASVHGGKAYQEGHTYVYDLEGSSVTSVPESQSEATLKLKGTVELSVKPDCIRQIRLKGVQINGAVSIRYIKLL